MRTFLVASFAVLVSLSAITFAASLGFTAPAGWKPVPTTSSMRVGQFAIPKAAGDAEDAEIVVYYFGGSGGTIEANIERWIGQMQQPDGKPSAGVAQRSKRTVNGLAVTLVDVSGTYIAEMAPGASERHNNPNFRLRAAVVETPNGPYYIKLTGGAKTVAAADKAFEQFIASLKYQP